MARRNTLNRVARQAVISVHTGIDMFITHRTARNLAPRTLRWYRLTLETVFRDIANHGTNLADVTKVTAQDIEAYLVRQMERGVKPVTLNGHVRSFNAYMRFLQQQELFQGKPPIIKPIRHEKLMLQTFSQLHISKLLHACDNNRFTGLRDRTAILLMLETGVRATELINIKVPDVNFSSGTIKVLGKGRKERIVPIQQRMAQQLRLYLCERGTDLGTDFLFITVDDRPLRLRSFEERITDIGLQAGLKNVRVSPHTFRHTFAKLYIQNGGDVFSLQKILGHTSLEMVRNYVNMFSTEVVAQHAKFSPIEKLPVDIDIL